MSDDKLKKELLAQEISKEEMDILSKDYDYCRILKTKHFEPDLQKVLDEISEILNFLTSEHLIELNMERYYVEGVTTPKDIEKNLCKLKGLLHVLHSKQIQKKVGEIDANVIPKRKDRLNKFAKMMKRQLVDQGVIEKCDLLLTASADECVVVYQKVDSILEYNKSDSARNKVIEGIKELRPLLNSFIESVIRLLNQIMYIDSIIRQVKTELYSIEHHIIREFNLRKSILDMLKQTPEEVRINAGSFNVFFVRADLAAGFKERNNAAYLDLKAFDESERYGKIYPVFFDTQRIIDKEHKKMKDQLDLKLRKSRAMTDEECKAFCMQNLFFNSLSPAAYCLVLQYHDGTFKAVNDTKAFNQEIIQFLIFHKYKDESFDKMLNSVVEPFFLSLEEKLSFADYKRAWKTSWEITKKIISQQLKQGDMTEKDADQIYKFMEKGYEELKMAQSGVAGLIKRGNKNPRYVNFIRHPYMVHQLMMDVLRVAIFAEARAKHNTEGKLIYTGRESGFEGANTVAVHGFNNYLKYKQLLTVMLPALRNMQAMDVFDHFEYFRAWLLMGLHDAATYDRQNSISYASMDKYGNSNKKAHNLIGSYILRENEVIKKLFGVADAEELSPEREEKNDLDMLASVIQNHDYAKIHLDMMNMGTDNKNMIKQLVLFTLSGIADNSAGVGFVDDAGECHVDPWEEKGSTVFLVTEKAPDMPGNPVGSMTNPEIMWYILSKMRDENDNYFIKTDEGKKEWNQSILPRVEANIKCMPAGIIKDKLIRGINENEFSQNSALWTAGVLNSGFMRVDGYDEKTQTLNITIVMDKKVNDDLKKIMNEKVYGRVGNFLKEYDGYYEGEINKWAIAKHFFNSKNKKTLLVHNSDMKGKKLESIGLHVKIEEKPGVMKLTLIEDTSKQLLAAADEAIKAADKPVHTDKGI